jgi:hypothetical protein
MSCFLNHRMNHFVILYLLQNTDTLLSSDCVNGQRPLPGNACNKRETVFFCGLRCGRFWATAGYTRSRGNEHERNNRRMVFSMWSVMRCYNLVSWSSEFSCEQYQPADHCMSIEAEESPLLRAVSKQWLGKTIKNWGLACAVVICKLCRSVIAL